MADGVECKVGALSWAGGWRADSERQHEGPGSHILATSQKGSFYKVPAALGLKLISHKKVS